MLRHSALKLSPRRSGMKRKIKTLNLRKETLRSLTPTELGKVAGGDPSDWDHMVVVSETCSYPIHEQPPIIVVVD